MREEGRKGWREGGTDDVQERGRINKLKERMERNEKKKSKRKGKRNGKNLNLGKKKLDRLFNKGY